MADILEISSLSKKYGNRQAVKDLSLKVPKGSVFGLLGPNGSGKTTTLGILCNTIIPDSGTYSWFGEKPKSDTGKRLGVILESPNFYPYMSAEDNLKLVAKIKNAGYGQIDELLQKTGLLDRKKDSFKSYSLGMKQRLAIAGALTGNPEVLILDEPTNGLDPEGIADVRRLIKEIAAEGLTIILASHLLDEVEKVCTHFAILSKGEKKYDGSVADALGKSNQVELGSDDMPRLKEILSELNIRIITELPDKIIVEPAAGVSLRELSQKISEKGGFLTHLSEKKNRLEDEFLKILNA